MKTISPFGRPMTITQRLIILIVSGFVAAALLLLYRTEHILEDAILEQVKHQSETFLFGLADSLEHELGSDREKLSARLDDIVAKRRDLFGFTVWRMYIFDETGKLLADTAEEYDEVKDVSLFHGNVFRTGNSFISPEPEQHYDTSLGRVVTGLDVIVPLKKDGVVVAALEADIDIEKTILQVKNIDDRFEREMFLYVVIVIGLMILFTILVVQRGLIRPVQILNSVTGRIAGGELSSRVEEEIKSEIGELGHSINMMADSIQRLFKEQEEAYFAMIQSLAKALEAKDAYTAGHSERVADVAVKLGRRIGLSEEEIALLRQGAYMHDLGKIGIEDAVLKKGEELSSDEFELIKSHPQKTAAIMAPLKRFKAFAEIAAWHHERWDGTGYPDGLKGEAIPLLARIVAVADAWDAMIGDRVYRKGMSAESAIARFEKERDSGQWDPRLITAFIEMIREEIERGEL